MSAYNDAVARRAKADANTPEARIANNLCPVCPGDLDTGWECNECGYDATPPTYTSHPTTTAADKAGGVPSWQLALDALELETRALRAALERAASRLAECGEHANACGDTVHRIWDGWAEEARTALNQESL